MTDAEITAAVAVVTRLLRDREDGTDDEVFALELITALRGHGWRVIPGWTAPEPTGTGLPTREDAVALVAETRARLAGIGRDEGAA